MISSSRRPASSPPATPRSTARISVRAATSPTTRCRPASAWPATTTRISRSGSTPARAARLGPGQGPVVQGVPQGAPRPRLRSHGLGCDRRSQDVRPQARRLGAARQARARRCTGCHRTTTSRACGPISTPIARAPAATPRTSRTGPSAPSTCAASAATARRSGSRRSRARRSITATAPRHRCRSSVPTPTSRAPSAIRGRCSSSRATAATARSATRARTTASCSRRRNASPATRPRCARWSRSSSITRSRPATR